MFIMEMNGQHDWYEAFEKKQKNMKAMGEHEIIFVL